MSEPDEKKTSNDNGKPPPRWLLKTFTRINVFVYRLSGGRLMNKLAGMPIVLVTMKGARSGRTLTIPLMYVPHERGYILVASQGGAPKHPAWYHNLRANPHCVVQLGRERFDAVAEELGPEEREVMWPKIVEMNHHQGEYLEQTQREIPLVWLRRSAER